MRILHTSDWHLGRSFKRVPLLEEQCRFTDQVVDLVGSEGIDLVVVPECLPTANQLAANTVAGYGYVTAHVPTAFGACLAAEVSVDSGQIIDLTSRLIAPNAATA
jgi:hypothetical protein